MFKLQLDHAIRSGALLAAAACACAIAVGTDVAYAEGSNSVLIQTINGRFVTAVSGGGIGGPNSGPGSAAIHTDAKYAQPAQWETFTCIALGPRELAFQTYSGSFVTAVNGGGIGGPNANPYEIHTDAKEPGPWERFKIVWLPGGKCALQTMDGHWLTAVNGGGWGEPANQYPIHTDATKIGPWETFRITYANELREGREGPRHPE